MIDTRRHNRRATLDPSAAFPSNPRRILAAEANVNAPRQMRCHKIGGIARVEDLGFAAVPVSSSPIM
jgi:hypothetical protein